jgi:hypothetical protein
LISDLSLDFYEREAVKRFALLRRVEPEYARQIACAAKAGLVGSDIEFLKTLVKEERTGMPFIAK